MPVALIGGWFWATGQDWNFIGAVETGNVAKVRAGLDRGIDPNKANMQGAKALTMITNGKKPKQAEIIRLLLDRGENPNDGIYFAADHLSPDIVRLLLDRGANPTYGLCSAVDARRTNVVQLLIARGANVNTDCSVTDRPVLLDAAEYGNNQIVRLLKDAGARK